jgi:hypothetical protein
MGAHLRAVAIACVAACAALSGCVYYLNPQCNDLIRNGDETGVDCGGPTCGKCDIGESCRSDTDCDESRCIGGTCVPLACDNGVRGEAETDIDCGGGTCRKCSGQRHCEADSDCFSGTCEPVTQVCSSLAAVSFGDAVPYQSGDKTYALFSGDLDGDGHIDLVAANEQENSLSVFLNNGTGDGTFHRLNVFQTGAYPTGGAIADFNHDGKPDVVTADYHGNSVSVLLGNGTGALATKSTYPTVPGAETSNLAVGDLNGDGNLDVVATNPQRASISVFLGNADGTLQPAATTSVGILGGTQPYSAAVADFNADGINDVAVADLVNGPIIVLLGTPTGAFQDAVLYPPGGTGPHILITYDINLDGKPDLITANRGSTDVSVLIGRGDGTFRKAIRSSTGPETTPPSGPYSIEVADFNLDGVPDLATANFNVGTASVLIGIGNGKFEPPIETPTATGGNSYGVAVGDFNGDGIPDLATANVNDRTVTVKLSTSH